MFNPREELKAAHGERAREQAHRERICGAIGRSEHLLARVEAEVEARDEAERQRRDALSDRLLAAIRSGELDGFEADDKAAAKFEMAKAADAARLDQAQRVVRQLKADLAAVDGELEAIEATIGVAINRILRGEAEKIATSWSKVSAEAKVLRNRLGRAYGPVFKLSETAGTPIGAAIRANAADGLDLEQHVTIESAWSDFAAELASGNCDAQISFLASDKAREAAEAEAATRGPALESIMGHLREFESRSVQ